MDGAAPHPTPKHGKLQTTNSSYTIETASWRDLNAVRRLEQICFPQDAWPLWDIVGVLTLPNVVRLKAVAGDQLVGFIAADVRLAQRVAWIATVGVLPEYRGQGMGQALMETCEQVVKTPTIRLNVRVSNATAIHLYERLGYNRVGLWPGYYSDGENALVMEKQR